MSKARPIRAVIFDMDGTLADSLSHIAKACNHVLSTFGTPIIPENEYGILAGGGNRILLERALKRSTNEDPNRARIDQAEALKTAYDNESGAKHIHPFQGASEALKVLTEGGYKLAVLSNKVQHLTVQAAEKCFPDTKFVAVHGARDDVSLKPSAAPALAILNDHISEGIQPDECAFVGDTSVDIKTALAAGMVPIGVSWGFRTMTELNDAGALAVVSTFKELVSVITEHGK